jgi:hypothetical protein
LSAITSTQQGPSGSESGPRELPSFELLAFRFQFTARDMVYFPPGKASNTVRGAFGTLFKQLVCLPDCHDAKACAQRDSCPYARIFEPVAQVEGPSGLKDWPRPFVFRAAHLDGVSVQPGRGFSFDIHLFDLKDPAVVYFVLAFAQLAKDGIGPRRGRAELKCVDSLDASGKPAIRVYDGTTFLATAQPAPMKLDLSPAGDEVHSIEVRFTTPTELKHGQLLATRPEFPVLFGRIRDRVSTLRALYGPGPLDIDFKEMGERAEQVQMTSCALRFSDAERHSAKTGDRHPLGGFVGEVRYEGNLGEFMPYLRAARWVGIGRQTVWGKGVIEIGKTT